MALWIGPLRDQEFSLGLFFVLVLVLVILTGWEGWERWEEWEKWD